jgi:hypothetical protein
VDGLLVAPGEEIATMRLLLLGATGLVGSTVLKQALADQAIYEVVAPTRRSLPPQDKLVNPVNLRLGEALFEGMKSMRRVFQGAATVDSILRGDLIERAAEAGLRSIFVGFETLTPDNLRRSNKRQNLGRDYKAVADRLHSLGIVINGSFVFGMDDDGEDVFRRTVDWAVEQGITTATFHIQTPYPGTKLHARMVQEGRMLTRDWNLYDTRHVVYQPTKLRPETLKCGYDWAYQEFYRWGSITRASLQHGTFKHQAKHFFYASGWKKFEPVWDLLIRARQLPHGSAPFPARLDLVANW